MQETTPLAGSSAGAIVCAVIASGASMQEALEVTKILAQDCRLNGTAFRLGVCVCLCLCGYVMKLELTTIWCRHVTRYNFNHVAFLSN